jgi:hypothetical protein
LVSQTLWTSARAEVDQAFDQIEYSALCDIMPSGKKNGGVLIIMLSAKVNARGGALSGNYWLPSFHIPNSSLSQARFNPDESKLRLVQVGLP